MTSTGSGNTDTGQETTPVDLKELAEELRTSGEDKFRGEHACAFLVVKHYPAPDSEFMDPKTVLTLLQERTRGGQAGAPGGGGGLPESAIPLKKSNRNVYTSKITVGRAKNNDIIIRAPKVSKLHAAFIHRDQDEYQLVDMGSANGTTLNGERMKKNKPTKLSSGDQVAFCHHEFEFLSLDVFIEVLQRLY